MVVIQSLEEISSYPQVVCALGTFDGVHLGHQLLIRQAVEMAKAEKNTVSMVITFACHPWQVLFPEREVVLLSERKSKNEYLASLGVDVLLELPGTKELFSMEGEIFLEKLFGARNVSHVFVGENYSFGKGGLGNVTLLQKKAIIYGTQVHVESLKANGEGIHISSTHIREALKCGDLEQANASLGRPFGFYDIVRHGDERGRLLGFPTANFWFPPHVVKPKDGVYVNRVRIGDTWYQGIGNIGDNPTFVDQRHRLEVHLLDFEGDLYGQELYVEFLAFLREELAFQHVEDLKSQMKLDEQKARAFFDTWSE